MTIKVMILMGSANDLEAMQPAADVLDELGIAYELHVASAHRTPDRVVELAREARAKGVAAFIAGAGGAHHLAGVLAAHTTLPIVAVPIASGTLGGIDALLSAVQMPSGVPVASVGVGGAKNAGLFAAAIVSVADAAVAQALGRYRERQQTDVLDADARVQAAGRSRPKKK